MTVARARSAAALSVAALLSVGALFAPAPAQADTPEGVTFEEYLGIEDGRAGQIGEIDTETAEKIIKGLDVAERNPEREDDYDRIEQFGDWATQASGNSADDDFCGDTRNDILNRDLDDVKYSEDDECEVASGTIHDPYTGATFDFERGPGKDKSMRVQIDHMLALGAGWALGADKLTQDEREALANDPENLIAVYGPANGSKGDRGPGDWTPADYKPGESDDFMPDLIDYNDAYECQYAAHYAWVVNKYDLSVTAEDKDAMLDAVGDCEIAAEKPTEDPTTPAPTPTDDPSDEPTEEPSDDPTLGPVPDDAESDSDADAKGADDGAEADADSTSPSDDGNADAKDETPADDAKADGGDATEGGGGYEAGADGSDAKTGEADAKDETPSDEADGGGKTPADEAKADGDAGDADAKAEAPTDDADTAAGEDPAPTDPGDESGDASRELTVDPRTISTADFLDKGVTITSTGHSKGEDVKIVVSHREDAVDPATFNLVADDEGAVTQGVHAIARAFTGNYDVVVSDSKGDMTSSFTVTDTAANAGGDSPSDDGSDSSPLPRTGAELTGLIAGIVLAVVGAVAVFLARARRKQD